MSLIQDRPRRDPEMALGSVLTLPSVALAELVAESLDFVWLDLEHGALGTADVQPLAIAARAADARAIVRVPSLDTLSLPAILDAGVDGIVAPRVESPADAGRLVERLRHPPQGSRGFAARRANGYGLPRTAPRKLSCSVQIESPAAVAAAEAIAAVDGVDAVVVGCADLALALTGRLEMASGELREAIARVEEAASAAGIASGIAGPDDARLLVELAGPHTTIFVLSADVRMYARGVADSIAALRAEVVPYAAA